MRKNAFESSVWGVLLPKKRVNAKTGNRFGSRLLGQPSTDFVSAGGSLVAVPMRAHSTKKLTLP